MTQTRDYDKESVIKRALKMTRGTEEMAESDKIPQIDPAKIEILIEKIEQNKLEEREKRRSRCSNLKR